MIDTDLFRDALSGWASGVTVLAIRTDERVVATTVSAFMSLSAEPPLILVAVGPNATIRPFLEPGSRFTVNILAAEQRRMAMIFADPFPVGESPFPESGDPVIDDALTSLVCTVERVDEGGDHAVVTAAVREAVWRHGAPLIRYRRRYHALDA